MCETAFTLDMPIQGLYHDFAGGHRPLSLSSSLLLQHHLLPDWAVLVFLGKGFSSPQRRKKVISVHLCQGATCPGLEAASVIYFYSFSVSFLSQGREDFYFPGCWYVPWDFGLNRKGGIWKLKMIKPARAWDLRVRASWSPRGGHLGAVEAEMAVKQVTWLRETWYYFYLEPDGGLQCNLLGTLFKSNGSQGTQTGNPSVGHEIPAALYASGKGGKYCVVIENNCFIFLPQNEGSLGTACPQTGHLTLYSHEFIKSHCRSCAIILLFLEVNQILSVVNKHWASPPTFLFIFKTPGVPWMTSSIWPRKIRDEKCCPTAGKNISIWLCYYKLPWVCVHWITVLSWQLRVEKWCCWKGVGEKGRVDMEWGW